MSASPVTAPKRFVKVPVHRTLPRLLHHPIPAFEKIGRETGGALTRLHLGLTRPYLVTHPEHAQHVLRDQETYRREGMLWKEVSRLEGDGLAGEGPSWHRSRRLLQPMFTTRSLGPLVGAMASAVTEALDSLAARTRDGRAVDLRAEMTRITHRVLIRVFFSNRISTTDGDRLGEAVNTALRTLSWRMLLPFVSTAVPLPGDRMFRRAVDTIDRIVYPLIRAYRGHDPADAGRTVDLVARCAHAVDEHGVSLDDKQVRDDVVALYVGGTETTAVTLTWLFMLLDRHPHVAARLVDEVTEVVGDGTPGPEHLPRLVHTRMALQEAMRLYPAAPVIPRRVARRSTIDDITLAPGSTVLLSPYLTHRLADFWDDPYEFRPERFGTDREWRRHRFAYLPFGAGAHQCLGNHVAMVEGQLAIAGLLSRFRPQVTGLRSMEPRMTVVLQPRHRAGMVLHPR